MKKTYTYAILLSKDGTPINPCDFPIRHNDDPPHLFCSLASAKRRLQRSMFAVRAALVRVTIEILDDETAP